MNHSRVHSSAKDIRVLRRLEILREYVAQLEATKSDLEKSLEDSASALTAAAAANRAKSDFLAALSHELRTLLNAIIGFSEIMTTQIFGPLRLHLADSQGAVDAYGITAREVRLC